MYAPTEAAKETACEKLVTYEESPEALTGRVNTQRQELLRMDGLGYTTKQRAQPHPWYQRSKAQEGERKKKEQKKKETKEVRRKMKSGKESSM